MSKENLLEIKKQIDESKETVSELKGERNQINKQLKDQYKCNSIEEAKKESLKYEKNIKTIDVQIEKGMEELEEKYEFD